MQGQAASLRGRGVDLSNAIASLDPFADEANTALRLLDTQSEAVSGLIRNSGEVFGALSERQGQLRGLIENTNAVFETTARRNEDLAEAFRIFPTFLRESRLTLDRLEQFAEINDPIVNALRPAADEVEPTFASLGQSAPQLERFFTACGTTIDRSKSGLRGAARDARQRPAADPRPARSVPRLVQLDPRGPRDLQARDHRVPRQRDRRDAGLPRARRATTSRCTTCAPRRR